jgi:hypothetical protein
MRVIVGIATHKGREETLKRTLESLYKQVDDIHVYDNEKESFNATDNGKFHFLHIYQKPIYALTCDDDLIYPPDYVERMIEGIEKYNSICTFHGRKLLGKGREYYKGHRSYACLHHFPNDCEIDVSGTGVTGFRTDYFNPTDLWKHEHKLMSDVLFAYEASLQGKKIMHLGHKGQWIINQPLPIEKTIYGREFGKAKKQQEICDLICDLKNIS